MLYHILLTNVLQFFCVFFKYAKYSNHIYKKNFQYYVGGVFYLFQSSIWRMENASNIYEILIDRKRFKVS